MRRSLLCALVLSSACSTLVACGDEDASAPLSRGARSSNADDRAGSSPAADPTAAQTTPASACAGVADAKQISSESNAGDLQITDGAIFYRAGSKIIRAALDGSGQVAVYESEKMLRSFVGGGFIVTIEDSNPPNAVLKVTTPEDVAAAPIEIATNFNAGGSYFIGADADALYLVGDEAQGEVIYRIARVAPTVLQPLVTVTEGISSAQVAMDGLWYVRDRTRVFKIATAAPDPNNPDAKVIGEPREVFGSQATACALAVGQDAAFCSVGAAVERRDLTGANLATLFEASKSKVAAPFGGATWFDGTLYVRTSTPDAVNGHALRALKGGGGAVEEKIVACGRTAAIGDVAVHKEVVAWTQPDKGVFVAPR